MNTCDWIIVGTRQDGEVIVLASNQLTEAELSTETEYYNTFGDSRERIAAQWHSLRAEMRGYQIATGPNYGVALANLFGMWQPEDREVIEGVRQVER